MSSGPALVTGPSDPRLHPGADSAGHPAAPAGPVEEIGGPQSIFRIHGYRPVPDGTDLAMRVGPWLDGFGGMPAVGSLGVLVDDVLGRPVFLARPAGTHLVTFELSLEVVAPPPWSGPELRAHGTVLDVDAARGLSRCEIRDGAGRLVATARAHLRFVAAGWAQPEQIRPTTLAAAAELSALDTLGPDVPDLGGRRFVVPARPEFGNGSGAVHGGILFCGCEQAAAADDPQGRLQTISVSIHYLRRAGLEAPVVYEVEPEHRGRSVAVYRVTARGAGGKPCAVATVARAAR
ncbi:uncharacterized protein UG55_10878 [Frankia sp. EI5c]|uniref:PaaI family thioesterase n=1 Tax=Frankia sp. EI5c TaxID=683316 RepID=UPI0007C2CD0C|nr:PaaI family thioesterase [Frankia sp. EI5c]OAA19654.1 uncharacterized protein UG55_10878 [Frankia sp. EI5c]